MAPLYLSCSFLKMLLLRAVFDLVCRSGIAEGTGSEGCLTRSSDASHSALVLSEKAGQAAVFVYDVTGKKVHRREV